MSKFLLGLAVLAFAATVFFVANGIHRHGEVTHFRQELLGQIAELERVASDPSKSPDAVEELVRRGSDGVDSGVDLVRALEDDRNLSAGLAGGSLMLGLAFVVGRSRAS